MLNVYVASITKLFIIPLVYTILLDIAQQLKRCTKLIRLLNSLAFSKKTLARFKIFTSRFMFHQNVMY